MSAARHLTVSANGQTIGTLIEQDDIWALEYADSWQQAAGAFPLSPALPLTQKLHRDGSSRRTVQWFFDNLLPVKSSVGRKASAPAMRSACWSAWGRNQPDRWCCCHPAARKPQPVLSR